MNKTLLKLIQATLSSIDSQDVNSIGDTAEALQIVDEAEAVFWDFITDKDWAFTKKLQQLEALGDVTKPNYLKIPDTVHHLMKVGYNVTESSDTNKKFVYLDYMPPEEFLELVQGRKSSESDVTEVTSFEGVTLLIKNDEDPKYWTSFDDKYVVFDSWLQSEDTTLQNSKSQALVLEEPTWAVSDSFEIPIPNHAYPAYVAAVKAACHEHIKQQRSATEERRAFSGKARLQHTQARASRKRNRADYGRK